MEGVEIWVVDALRHTPAHPAHFTVEQALDWIRRLDVPHGVLTHMHNDLDYNELKRELPRGIEPAYDGMIIEMPD
jgi:phosphoribosyl 1,2-cyclic phosphate phosphodiesterase